MDRSKNVQEERYSRQAYTLGAHAQKQIRSDHTIVVLDGACGSGLIYETAKNLALSGVRQIVIVQSDDEFDACYHNSELDDLGNAYQRSIFDGNQLKHVRLHEILGFQ